MPGIEMRWWGAVVHLDRYEGCLAATGVPAARDLLLQAIPPPYGPIVLAAVQQQKQLIGSRMGTEGVDLHFNWIGGFIHLVETKGQTQPCE
jgi:hypothetical protein